jgi:hypothetical protein
MSRPHWLDRTDLWLIALTLAIKAGLIALGAIAIAMGHGSFENGLLSPWDRWDAPHYTDIAVFGYVANDPGTLVGPNGYRQVYPGDLDLYIVFYPLFPWLVGAVSALIAAPVVAAFAVTGVASLFVGPLLRRLVAVDLGAVIGARSAYFLLVFPTAYFLHIGYTEALFLALALGSFWLARTDRWWLAGVVAALATLTRVNGLLLLPALAVEAWLQWRSDPDRRLRIEWLAIGGVVIGFAAYLALNAAVYGDALAFARIQREHWSKELAPPWEGIGNAFDFTDREDAMDALMYGWIELASLGLGLAGIIASASLHFRPSWTVWMAGNVFLIASTSFVLSTPRYDLVLFALFPWFAVMAERRPLVGVAISSLSLAGLGWFAWRFASGQWAF